MGPLPQSEAAQALSDYACPCATPVHTTVTHLGMLCVLCACSQLRLAGSCSGTQLTLASDMLPFGPVALGSGTTKRLALDNTGDTGEGFRA